MGVPVKAPRFWFRLALYFTIGLGIGTAVAAQAPASARATHVIAGGGPLQQSMGVVTIGPAYPDSANPTYALFLTCDSGCYVQSPPQARVQLRLRSGTKWYDTTNVLRVKKGEHLRLSQKP